MKVCKLLGNLLGDVILNWVVVEQIVEILLRSDIWHVHADVETVGEIQAVQDVLITCGTNDHKLVLGRPSDESQQVLKDMVREARPDVDILDQSFDVIEDYQGELRLVSIFENVHDCAYLLVLILC